MISQYDYVELTREVKIPEEEEVDEGMSTHSLQDHSAAMGTHHEKNQDSMDSANQLAEWAHRA
jgi:Amt family ammonium transporter